MTVTHVSGLFCYLSLRPVKLGRQTLQPLSLTGSLQAPAYGRIARGAVRAVPSWGRGGERAVQARALHAGGLSPHEAWAVLLTRQKGPREGRGN
jgi:hypothetical protein